MFSNPLIYFVVIPVVMLLGVYLSRNMAQIRAVAVTGSLLLTALSVWLLVDYLGLRAAGATDPMLYCGDWTWFEPSMPNFLLVLTASRFADMLLLSSIILLTGSFVFMEDQSASQGILPVADSAVERVCSASLSP